MLFNIMNIKALKFNRTSETIRISVILGTITECITFDIDPAAASTVRPCLSEDSTMGAVRSGGCALRLV